MSKEGVAGEGGYQGGSRGVGREVNAGVCVSWMRAMCAEGPCMQLCHSAYAAPRSVLGGGGAGVCVQSRMGCAWLPLLRLRPRLRLRLRRLLLLRVVVAARGRHACSHHWR